MPILLEDDVPYWNVLKIIMAQPVVAGLGSLVGYNLSMLPWLLELYQIPREHHELMINVVTEAGSIAVNSQIEKDKAKG